MQKKEPSTSKQTVYQQELTFLKKIKELLDSHGASSDLKESEDGCGLFLPLAPAGNTSDLILSIQVQQQPVPNIDLENLKEIPSIYSILFSVHFPNKLSQDVVVDTLLLMNFINHEFPIGKFSIELGNLVPEFTYILLGNEAGLDKTLIMSIIGSIMFAMDTYYPIFIDVSSKNCTFEDALHKLAPLE